MRSDFFYRGWRILRFKAVELHGAWSGALFASSGALMVNVLTGFQYSFQYIGALILAFLSLFFFSYFTKIKAIAEKNFAMKTVHKMPDKLQSEIYEDVFEKGPFPRHATISLCCGLLCLMISVFLVIWANVERVNAGQKRSQEHILILETAKEEICRQLSEQSDTFREQLLEQSDALREQLLKQSKRLRMQYELQVSGKTSTPTNINSNDASQHDRPANSQ